MGGFKWQRVVSSARGRTTMSAAAATPAARQHLPVIATMTPMTPAAAANVTIPELFAATVAGHADEPALGIIENANLHWQTWRQLAGSVDRWAAGLLARGVQHGDRV